MVNEPTVLILGAGASSDYKFPLGRKLRDLVCALKGSEASSAIENAGYSLELLNEFIETLMHSGFSSVDWFLEERPEFIPIGKAAIAAALIPFEDPTNLFPPKAPLNHWFELLLNVLAQPIGNFGSNCLSIITFNYDRALEYYLLTTLTTRYRSEEKAVEAMNNFPIVHVHGTLGSLTPLAPIGRPYLPGLTPQAIQLATKELIIVGEASGDTEEFKNAKSLLESAKRIVFLGFGFHPESIKRLSIFNVPWTDEMRKNVRVGGTTREIPVNAWNHIQANVLNGAYPESIRKVNPVYDYLNAAEPLDEHALQQTHAVGRSKAAPLMRGVKKTVLVDLSR